jgi:fermentation-respiration switch protein FrsA (DUF1100 family)
MARMRPDGGPGMGASGAVQKARGERKQETPDGTEFPPLLVIAGENDRVVPVERTEALLDHWEGEWQYELFADREHNDLHLDPRFWPSIRQFLQQK